MAIKLQKPTRYGDTVTAEYWRVGIANIHPRTKYCGVVLDGYVNKAARDANKDSVQCFELSVPWEAFANGNNPNIKDIYLYLKSLPDWGAGEDI
jgi:hypothetical protein